MHTRNTIVTKMKAEATYLLYRKTLNISLTKSQNWNVSYFILQLFLTNPLKSGVKSRIKIYLEQRRQAML